MITLSLTAFMISCAKNNSSNNMNLPEFNTKVPEFNEEALKTAKPKSDTEVSMNEILKESLKQSEQEEKLREKTKNIENCESSIRLRMKKKDFRYSKYEGFEDYSEQMNQILPLFNNDSFAYSKYYDVTQSLILASSITGDTEKPKLELTLSKIQQKNVNFLVKLKTGKTKDLTSTTLEQSFYFDKNCSVTNGPLVLMKITDMSPSKEVSITKVIGEENVKPKETTKTLIRETTAPLLETVDVKSLKDLPLNSYIYSEEFGLIPAFSISYGRSKIVDETPYKISELSLKIGKSNYVKGEIGENLALSRLYTNFFGETVAFTTKERWDLIEISKSEEHNKAKVSLPKNYFEKNDKIIFSSTSPREYEDMPFYWSQEGGSTNGINHSRVLKKSTNTLIFRYGNDADLESNEVFNTQNAEIQRVKALILSKKPRNNKQKAQYILDYISENFSYDYELANSDNKSYRFTVDELLERKKGVCTHFSILFVTLARSLGIESRVIAGFVLSPEGAMGHAWVEFETYGGLWTAIDPQNKNVKDSVLDKMYYPIANYTNLGKNDPVQQDLLTFYLSSPEIRPYTEQNKKEMALNSRN